MSHPLLNQLEHVIGLMERVNKLDDEIAKDDLTKYLRWAARKVAKAYWHQIDRHGETVDVWDTVAHKLNADV